MKITSVLAMQFILIISINQFVLFECFAIFSSIMSVLNFGGKWGLQAFTGFLGFHGSEQLFSLMKGDSDKFADLQREMQSGFEKLNDQISTSSELIVNRLSQQILSNTEFNRIFHHIEQLILTISTQFTNLQKLLENEKEYQNDTLFRNADHLTSSSDRSVHSAMSKLDTLINKGFISSQLSKGAIMAIINYLKALHDLKHCESITAPLEVMYVFLHYLIMTQLKGMVTIQEAFNLLTRITKNTKNQTDLQYYSAEYQRIEREASEYIKNLLEHMSKLKHLSPYSFTCMPHKYTEHENYERLINFLPVYLTREHGLEHYYKKRSQYLIKHCSEDCPWYDIATFHSNPKTEFRLNYINRCWGMIRNCKLADVTGNICIHDLSLKKGPQMQMYTKHDKKCNLSADTTTTRYEWFVDCNTCQCVCDTHVGENFVYIAPMMAKYGEVVTGVRFEKQNNTIFYNIETAYALPFAFANNSGAHWHELPKNINPYLNRDKYFQIFHWCRHIVLGDVTVNKDQVVVGVQLYPVPGKRCAFNLRVFGRQINIVSGQYTEEDTVSFDTKIYNDTEVIETSDLISGVDGNPQKLETGETKPKLVKLSNSIIRDNLGQYSLPFFDTQPVTTHPKMVQSGVGIYYRTTQNHAGYLAPRLTAFNCMEYLDTIETKDHVLKKQLDQDIKRSGELVHKSPLEKKS